MHVLSGLEGKWADDSSFQSLPFQKQRISVEQFYCVSGGGTHGQHDNAVVESVCPLPVTRGSVGLREGPRTLILL